MRLFCRFLCIQVVGSLAAILNSASGSSGAPPDPAAAQQRADTRASMFAAVAAIAGSNPSLLAAPASLGSVVSMVADITAQPREVKPALAVGASTLLVGAVTAAVASATAPLPAAISVGLLNTVAASVAAVDAGGNGTVAQQSECAALSAQAAQTVARNLVAGSVPGQAPAMIQACWSNRCGESSAASESKYAQISLFIFHHKWQTLPVVECLATLVSLFITNNVENFVSTPIC